MELFEEELTEVLKMIRENEEGLEELGERVEGEV
jgi:hypothetical protein